MPTFRTSPAGLLVRVEELAKLVAAVPVSLASGDAVDAWVRRSHAYAQQLPPTKSQRG